LSIGPQKALLRQSKTKDNAGQPSPTQLSDRSKDSPKNKQAPSANILFSSLSTAQVWAALVAKTPKDLHITTKLKQAYVQMRSTPLQGGKAPALTKPVPSKSPTSQHMLTANN